MPDLDHYEAYYADKLWAMLPVVYRASDSDSFTRKGPLREMIDRIGAQAAVLRRNIDRLWENQSIETCDDWVIAYIGDLLATNLVSSLDARGQRLDVAKTIYYRRRKGTVALLEELAADMTGWNVRVVEFFRRLGRTRHGFDPQIGYPANDPELGAARTLQLAEGLVGARSGTPLGGWADLRDAFAATKTRSAFDEFAHTADVRRGRGATGWHNISHLGVFIWRLTSFGIGYGTPVAKSGCPGHFTFDPTGREIPLFAAAQSAFGDKWVSPKEWQMPGEIGAPLLATQLDDLYATTDSFNALGVYDRVVMSDNLLPPASLTLYPEIGRFKLLGPAPAGTLLTGYHYGFSSTIGAGPYDRRQPGEAPVNQPQPVLSPVSGGGILPAPPAQGTQLIADNLTYTAISDPTPVAALTIAAAPLARPVVRPAAGATWTFTGGGANSTLDLDGLLLSGVSVVLAGSFAAVRIHCCSFDPGEADSSGDPGRIYAAAADLRDLVPSPLVVTGQVRTLIVERSIMGPVRTEGAGLVEHLLATDSIIQAAGAIAGGAFAAAALINPKRMAFALRTPSDALDSFVRGTLPSAVVTALDALGPDDDPPPALMNNIVAALNTLAGGALIYDAARFALRPLSALVLDYVAQAPTGADLQRCNRMLLKEAYPAELLERGDLAVALDDGLFELERVTVLGPLAVHRLHASESLLDDLAFVANTQDGCLRFSATAAGSVVPRRYECVTVAPRAGLFTSRRFGQPGYGQVSLAADRMINGGGTILQGVANGSEMGAFSRDLNPLKERSLRIKYREYMPVGLMPTLIYAT